MARTIRNNGAGTFRTVRKVKADRKQSRVERRAAKQSRVEWRGNTEG
jgi:hypothetical protein